MTDEPQRTADDLAAEAAKVAAAVPPEPVPDTDGLPDDTKDGAVEP